MLHLYRKIKYKLLQAIPHKGLDLRSSLSALMWGFALIKYKLSLTRPHTEVALRDSLATRVWGLVLLIIISLNQTITMKKLLHVFVLCALLLPGISFASFDTNLRYGARGEAVSEVQDFLIDQGFMTGTPTGNFYALTLKAVKAFQSKNKITPISGYWGPLTRSTATSLLDLTESDTESKAEQTQTSFAPLQPFNPISGFVPNSSPTQSTTPQITTNTLLELSDLKYQYLKAESDAMTNVNYPLYKNSTEQQLFDFLNAPGLIGTYEADQKMVKAILEMRKVAERIRILGGVIPVSQYKEPVVVIRPKVNIQATSIERTITDHPSEVLLGSYTYTLNGVTDVLITSLDATSRISGANSSNYRIIPTRIKTCDQDKCWESSYERLVTNSVILKSDLTSRTVEVYVNYDKIPKLEGGVTIWTKLDVSATDLTSGITADRIPTEALPVTIK